MIRVAKQPNGLYCAFVSNSIQYNLTEDDYYDLALQDIKDKFVTKGYVEGVNTIISKVSDDTILTDMGFTQPHDELVKWLPRKVIDKNYYSRDCVEHGRCPKCKTSVENGISGKDDICPNCGQVLEW